MTIQHRPILIIGSSAEAIKQGIQPPLHTIAVPSIADAPKGLLPRLLIIESNSDGWEMFTGEAPQLPWILITDSDDKAAITRALDLHCSDFITRPVAPEELHFRVTLALKNYVARDQIARELDTLREHSERDPLTHLYNRRAFTTHAKRLLAHAQRHNNTVALLLLDIDNFKGFNDTYGHQTGDAILCQIGSRLLQRLRTYDLLARVGGDEMCILLSPADSTRSEHVAQKLIDAVGEEPFTIGEHTLPVTITIGSTVAAVHEELSRTQVLETMTAAADAALYQAKEAGRNQFASHPPKKNSKEGV